MNYIINTSEMSLMCFPSNLLYIRHTAHVPKWPVCHPIPLDIGQFMSSKYYTYTLRARAFIDSDSDSD